MKLNFILSHIEILIFKGNQQFDLLHDYNLVSTKIDKINLELLWQNQNGKNDLKMQFINLKYLEICLKNFQNVYGKNQLFYRMLNIGFINPNLSSEEVEFFEHEQNIDNSLHLIMFFGDDEYIRVFCEHGDVVLVS